MKIAVGFFTHRFDSEVHARYLKLKTEAQGVDCYIVAEKGTPVPRSLHSETVFFDFEQIMDEVPAVYGDSLIPGNCHLTMLSFQEKFPNYDAYWQVEYDVIFTGSWDILFDAFQGNDSDLLAPHLRTIDEEPDWAWWESLNLPLEYQNTSQRRAFLPVYRISKRGLKVVREAVGKGASGHFEALIPTLLGASRLQINDLGAGRFYTSSQAPHGSLILGTMRYRPAHYFPALARNYLYHPVKIGTPWPNREDVGALLFYFCKTPLHALKDMLRSAIAVVKSRLA